MTMLPEGCCPTHGTFTAVCPMCVADAYRLTGEGGFKPWPSPPPSGGAFNPPTVTPERRPIFRDGSLKPRYGDLARVLEDVPLEGGRKLRRDQNVLVESIGDEEAQPKVVGIKWRDRYGTHVMAMDVDKLEIVP